MWLAGETITGRAGRRAGGVKLVSGTERITLDNTLDERLRLLEDRVCTSSFRAADDCGIAGHVANFYCLVQMLPEIRTDLFGTNPNRKFYT